MKKNTVELFANAKRNEQKVTMLTAYDYSMARIVDEAGIDAILVGDSLGMVMQGHDSTLEVTVNDIIYHCRAVARGVNKAMIIGDMPFLSYHISVEEAVRNAGKIVQEGKASAIKLEGGIDVIDKIKAIIRAQIPVMGHIGLTPQSVNLFGGFKIQGREESAAKKIIEDALALEKAGVFAIVLEAIPEVLAKMITEKLHIPTIGIGAGKYCDGQILVVNDLLGMYAQLSPKFVKKYADLNQVIKQAISTYIDEVKEQSFPEEKHTFQIDQSILEKLYGKN